MTLHIPNIDPDASALTWALAYAEAGWYIGPVRVGTKNPGSVLGNSWQTLTSRDPDTITAWFAGTDHGIFLHCGRSGAVVLDVDHPDKVPAWLRPLLAATVTQSTRSDNPARGHYLYATDTMYGNGLGGLEKGWGDIRGRNGVIVVAPSQHPDGGHYQWRRTGLVTPLPLEIADKLAASGADAESTATDREVEAFLNSASNSDAPHTFNAVLITAKKNIEDGVSRHDACQKAVAWAMDDAAAGLYPARTAVDTLRRWWEGLFTTTAAGKRAKPSPGEFDGMIAWAVAQALAKSSDQLQERRDRVISNDDPTLPDDSYSDQALAVRFLQENVSHLRFVTDTERWAAWNGRYWVGPNALNPGEGDNEVLALLASFLVAVGREAMDAVEQQVRAAGGDDDEVAKARGKVRSAFESASKIKNVIHMVRVRAPKIAGIKTSELDADPWLLNVANGILNLKTGELGPHDPEKFQTMITRGAFDWDADPTLFLRVLTEAQPDPDVRAYLRRRAGAALIGSQIDHVLHIDYGERGRNGKGIHLGALKAALGDYAAVAPAEVLLTTKESKHPEELARLRGKRVVWVDELRQERGLDDARVKTLTGGTERTARFMRQNSWEYRPSDTWMLSTNQMPKFRGDDDALRTRLRIVPWNVSFAGREDTSIPLRIEHEELDGVLTWMVQGCIEYLSDGLAPPLVVAQMTSDLADEADPVGAWAAEEVVIDPESQVPAKVLYARFRKVFADEHPSEKVPSQTAFGRSLSAHLARQGVTRSRAVPHREGGKVVRVYRGVGLSEAASGSMGRDWFA